MSCFIRRWAGLSLLLSLLLFSCTMESGSQTASVSEDGSILSRTVVNGELFEMTNYPEFTRVTEIVNSQGVNDLAVLNVDGRISYLSEPWNYEKPENDNRKYPLVVFLHASATKHNLNWYLTEFLGNGSGVNAQRFKSSNPAFIYFPFASTLLSFDGDYDKLIGDIETLISKRRIEPSRIYLIGYENGSDAVVEVTRRYNNATRGIAGAVRISGRRRLTLTEDVRSAFLRTPLWQHTAVGERVLNRTVASDNFQLFRTEYQSTGTVISVGQVVDLRVGWVMQDMSYLTETLTVDGVEKAKWTLYGDPMRNVTYENLYDLPYQIQEFSPWLFSKRWTSPKTPEEHLNPQTVTHNEQGRIYHTRIPSNYELPENSDKKYPLLIYLHGSSSLPVPTWMFPYHLRDDKSYVKEYPHYFYLPFATQGNTYTPDIDLIIADIERLVREERIDPERIYLMGYSLGSTTTIELSRAFYNRVGKQFAAVVKISGATGHKMVEDVQQALSRSSLWIHSGNADNYHGQVDVAGDSFQLFKNHYSNGVLSSIRQQSRYLVYSEWCDNYPYTTETLTVAGDERFKWTIYGETGVNPAIDHGRVLGMPFQNPDFYPWLFSRRLK